MKIILFTALLFWISLGASIKATSTGAYLFNDTLDVARDSCLGRIAHQLSLKDCSANHQKQVFRIWFSSNSEFLPNSVLEISEERDSVEIRRIIIQGYYDSLALYDKEILNFYKYLHLDSSREEIFVSDKSDREIVDWLTKIQSVSLVQQRDIPNVRKSPDVSHPSYFTLDFCTQNTMRRYTYSSQEIGKDSDIYNKRVFDILNYVGTHFHRKESIK